MAQSGGASGLAAARSHYEDDECLAVGCLSGCSSFTAIGIGASIG